MPATPEFNNYTNSMPQRLVNKNILKNILKIEFARNRFMMISI
jgi:hypothetical protein